MTAKTGTCAQVRILHRILVNRCDLIPILFAGNDEDPRFACPRDLDLIQSVPPLDLLSMKAPPRVLTLTEQPLDSLETEQTANSQTNPSQAVSDIKISIMCFFYFFLFFRSLI